MVIDFDVNKFQTPYYVVDERLVLENLKVLQSVSKKTGCQILLAQKAFSMFSMYPLISKYLDGTTASGVYEAKLGKEHFGKQTHIFSPAYTSNDFEQICNISDYVIFNSKLQLDKFRKKAIENNLQIGIRINPEHSTQDHAIYDPCAKGSRLGITKVNFDKINLEGVSGLHFHTLCEQNASALVETLQVVEEKFAETLHKIQWVNMGGGHHITRSDYDVNLLVETLNNFKRKYDVQVFLEPGEAVVLNTGFLVSEVLDIIENDIKIAILDASAACHMPDVLEMPYRPHIIGSDISNKKPFTYRLAGATCLAGDIIGDYSFDNQLEIGDKLIFCDMSHYSMVKNNTFNGMPLPAIAKVDQSGNIMLVKEFNYTDFKNRLS